MVELGYYCVYKFCWSGGVLSGVYTMLL